MALVILIKDGRVWGLGPKDACDIQDMDKPLWIADVMTIMDEHVNDGNTNVGWLDLE